MMGTGQRIPRGTASAWLWLGVWASLATIALTMAVDGFARQVPPVVWVLWYLPLAVFVPGMLRDRLRSMAWLSFVVLMYFVAAVQRIFAEPGSLRAQLELLAVIGLFLTTMYYVRMRGPELRAAREGPESGPESGPERAPESGQGDVQAAAQTAVESGGTASEGGVEPADKQEQS